MRSIERIDNFLRILGEEWKKSPDQRFTQFLFNHGLVNTDAQYHMEEVEVLGMMFPEINAREIVFWGTRGKDGTDPLKYKLVKDLDTDHIEAILKTQRHISDAYRILLENELALRKQ